MSKKNAGERKRTVTITVGEQTWDLLERIKRGMEERNSGIAFDMTSVAGGLLMNGIVAHCHMHEMTLAKDHTNTFR